MSDHITLISSYSCLETLLKLISEVVHTLSIFYFKDMQKNHLCPTLLDDIDMYMIIFCLNTGSDLKAVLLLRVIHYCEKKERSQSKAGNFQKHFLSNTFRDLCSQLIWYLKWNHFKSVSLTLDRLGSKKLYRHESINSSYLWISMQ